MKFSIASLLFVASFAAPSLVNAETTQVSSSQELDNHGSTDIFSRLRIGVNGIKKRPEAQDIAFLSQAMKRAYNSVHAPLNDNYNFLDFNCTAIEMQAEDAEATEHLFQNVYDTLERLSVSNRRQLRRRRYIPPRGYRISTYGISDITCNLCADDDSTLGLRGGADDLTVKPPFADIKPVAEMLCKILKKEGAKSIFSDVHGCSIFQIDSLGTWEFNKANDSQVANNAVLQDTAISIDLAGLTCNEKQDFVACHDDSLRTIVSDALVIAYNKVNFADDFFVADFVPSSIELYRGEDADLALRGKSATLAPVLGLFRGSVHVQCRACDDDIDYDDAAMAPFYKLKEVETIFCEMISAIADETTALESLQGCSLAVLPLIANEAASLVVETE